MEKIRVTKKFTFDLAHALFNYDGSCRFIHGHTYHLRITLLGNVLMDVTNPKNGMVIDFKELKKLVKEKIMEKYDHALMLSKQSFNELNSETLNEKHKLIISDFQPTCENILVEIKNDLISFFSESIQLVSIRLDETENSYAEWILSDQK